MCRIGETSTTIERKGRTYEEARGRSARRTAKEDKNFREKAC